MSNLTNSVPAEQFLSLAKQYEAMKEQLKTLGDQLEAIMTEMGYDTYVQDPETGLVYKTYLPDGTFVSYKSIAFKRTSKEGERGGVVLSKKEAEEQGFLLRK